MWNGLHEKVVEAISIHNFIWKFDKKTGENNHCTEPMTVEKSGYSTLQAQLGEYNMVSTHTNTPSWLTVERLEQRAEDQTPATTTRWAHTHPHKIIFTIHPSHSWAMPSPKSFHTKLFPTPLITINPSMHLQLPPAFSPPLFSFSTPSATIRLERYWNYPLQHSCSPPLTSLHYSLSSIEKK